MPPRLAKSRLRGARSYMVMRGGAHGAERWTGARRRPASSLPAELACELHADWLGGLGLPHPGSSGTEVKRRGQQPESPPASAPLGTPAPLQLPALAPPTPLFPEARTEAGRTRLVAGFPALASEHPRPSTRTSEPACGDLEVLSALGRAVLRLSSPASCPRLLSLRRKALETR